MDAPAETQALLERLKGEGKPLGFPLACDPTRAAVKAFGVYDAAHDIALPAMVVLDRNGKVAWRYSGESIFDRPAEQGLVETLSRLKSS